MSIELLREYLTTHSLQDLERDHGVGHRISANGLKATLNYNQINAVDSDPIACVCRGLVVAHGGKINEKDVFWSLSILAYPMNRFFNYGQGHNHIDLDTAEAQEKLDGTCCIVYWDGDAWCVGTRGTPDADVPISSGLMGTTDLTFRKLFEMACLETTGRNFDKFCSFLHKDSTYVFELTTPVNTIVVRYPDYRITLLTARYRHSSESNLEWLDATAILLKVPRPRVFPLTDLTALVAYVNSLPGAEEEGVVVVDAYHNRVKIKNLAYVAIHHAKDIVNTSPRKVMGLILDEKVDDLLPFLLQEERDYVLGMQDKLRDLVKSVDAWADVVLAPGGDRKDLALRVQASEYSSFMSYAMARYQNPATAYLPWLLRKRNPDGTIPDSVTQFLLERLK